MAEPSSVANATALDVGLAPSMAMSMCYVAMADSMGIAMGNAVSNQQRGQVLAGAALAKVLTLIIAKGST
ncbi:MAG: RebB family R body protein [Rhodospirillaceae bacterium]|nr:RebB family R body protein [Rhodospirillales bacterium]